ncbi:MAG: hydrolase 1, exosortase A system-associated [Casimicrobiaceae bacterium]
MIYSEQALAFECNREHLVGILAKPEGESETGVVIVVGGPQYRAGSHRQFVLLSRRLAADGIPALRFDYRGMGDSTGEVRSFEEIDDDVAAAIEAICMACPRIKKIVLWGLCDGASAALTYWSATRDARVAAMVLLNPWVRSAASEAKARIKYYYARRLLDAEFWTKLVRGRLNVFAALAGFARAAFALRAQPGGPAPYARNAFQDRMADGLQAFAGPILLILSGRDLTASEFVEYTRSSPRWTALLARSNLLRREIRGADHTFSSAQWREEVETQTIALLRRLAADVRR